jgi:hypothetical protein
MFQARISTVTGVLTHQAGAGAESVWNKSCRDSWSTNVMPLHIIRGVFRFFDKINKKSVQRFAHAFLYTFYFDDITFKTKSINYQQTISGYWIPNNSEIRVQVGFPRQYRPWHFSACSRKPPRSVQRVTVSTCAREPPRKHSEVLAPAHPRLPA